MLRRDPDFRPDTAFYDAWEEFLTFGNVENVTFVKYAQLTDDRKERKIPSLKLAKLMIDRERREQRFNDLNAEAFSSRDNDILPNWSGKAWKRYDALYLVRKPQKMSRKLFKKRLVEELKKWHGAHG